MAAISQQSTQQNKWETKTTEYRYNDHTIENQPCWQSSADSKLAEHECPQTAAYESLYKSYRAQHT